MGATMKKRISDRVSLESLAYEVAEKLWKANPEIILHFIDEHNNNKIRYLAMKSLSRLEEYIKRLIEKE